MKLGLGVPNKTLTLGGGGGEIPLTAIFFNGVPILYNGNYLTYN